jgi:tetratricopeptide (TPR) repeat protein
MSLSNPQESLATFRDAVAISREINDRPLEETVLTNISRAYLQLGDSQAALDYANRALSLQRKLSDKRGEGVSLGTIGSVYTYMGDSEKALASYRQALDLVRAASDHAMRNRHCHILKRHSPPPASLMTGDGKPWLR